MYFHHYVLVMKRAQGYCRFISTMPKGTARGPSFLEMQKQYLCMYIALTAVQLVSLFSTINLATT